MNSARLYLRYLSLSLQSQLQYRLSFVLQTLAHFSLTFVDFLTIYVLFERFSSIGGWKLDEIAFFYGTITLSFALADAMARGFDMMGHLVKSGDLDRMLLRPRSLILQILGYEFTLKRIGRFSQGLAVLLWASVSLKITWSLPALLFFLFTIGSSMALFVALMIFQAAFSFWTTESLEIMNILTYGGRETAQFPLTVYAPWLRKFFTYIVPLACVNYFPLLPLLGKTDSLGTTRLFQYLSPLAGYLFLFLILLFWKQALKRYNSTGS